jgi:hypothetical protein
MNDGALESHRKEYHDIGLTILRDAIPRDLLEILREHGKAAREVARGHEGAQARELQPIWDYPEVDPQPFQAFLALERLSEAVQHLLSADHTPAVLGVLIEPAERPVCTEWHRDWLYHASVDRNRFWDCAQDLKMFGIMTAALYDDHCFWFVPGSHNRPDTQAELEAAHAVNPAHLRGDGPEVDAELSTLHYARRMPGAVQVHLMASDIMLWRQSAWHLGRYLPYAPRLSLTDAFLGPGDRAWRRDMLPRTSPDDRSLDVEMEAGRS